MPISSIDDVVVPLEVLIVTRPAVWIGHDMVSAGVDCGQPAEEALVRRGGVLARSPVPGHVEGVSDHQLPPVQVGTENKGDVLHPVDNCTSFRCHLEKPKQRSTN